MKMIRAKELKTIMSDAYDSLVKEYGNHDAYVMGYGAAFWFVDQLSGEDAEPVKHAMWHERRCGNGWNDWPEYTCSACGARYEKLGREKLNYCPNCGAKMDKELEDER